jgi:hypothetical protein
MLDLSLVSVQWYQSLPKAPTTICYYLIFFFAFVVEIGNKEVSPVPL